MKNKSKFFLLLIVQIICTVFINAKELTLVESLEIAKENNSEIIKQQLILNDAKRKAMNSWNKFLPSLSVSGNTTNSHDFEEVSNWTWKANLGTSLSFTFGTPASIKQLQLTYLTEKNNYEKLIKTLEVNVSTQFYSLISEKKKLEILEDSQKLTNEVYLQIKKNYENGLASELDMLKAQYSYLSVEPQLKEAKSTFSTNLASFALLIGLSEDKTITLLGDINLVKVVFPSNEELINKYLNKRIDIINSQIAIEQAKISKTITTANNLLPSLSLSENISLSENQLSSENSLNLNGTFSVGISIPLSTYIPNSQAFLEKLTTVDNIQKAELSYKDTQANAKNDIQTKRETVDRLWGNLDLSKLNLSIAERSYELSKEGYNSGLVSQTDLESARQQMVNAKQTSRQNQIQYLQAVYQASLALNLDIEEFYKIFGGSNEKN